MESSFKNKILWKIERKTNPSTKELYILNKTFLQKKKNQFSKKLKKHPNLRFLREGIKQRKSGNCIN